MNLGSNYHLGKTLSMFKKLLSIIKRMPKKNWREVNFRLNRGYLNSNKNTNLFMNLKEMIQNQRTKNEKHIMNLILNISVISFISILS